MVHFVFCAVNLGYVSVYDLVDKELKLNVHKNLIRVFTINHFHWQDSR